MGESCVCLGSKEILVFGSFRQFFKIFQIFQILAKILAKNKAKKSDFLFHLDRFSKNLKYLRNFEKGSK